MPRLKRWKRGVWFSLLNDFKKSQNLTNFIKGKHLNRHIAM